MYGNFGGWGGLGGFPTRRDVPNSQRVESDQEFAQGWQNRVPPEYIGGNQTTKQGWETNMQSDAPFSPAFNAPGGPGIQSMTAGQDYGFGAPGGAGIQSITNGQDYNHQKPMAPGGFGVQSVSMDAPRERNPQFDQMQAAAQQATLLRNENQLRQQQAYDSGMMGDYDRNAVLGPNYSKPGYGQISGQNQAGAFGADGGTQLGGVDNSFVTGAYVPSQSGAVYNPNPYSANSFDPFGWGI